MTLVAHARKRILKIEQTWPWAGADLIHTPTGKEGKVARQPVWAACMAVCPIPAPTPRAQKPYRGLQPQPAEPVRQGITTAEELRLAALVRNHLKRLLYRATTVNGFIPETGLHPEPPVTPTFPDE